MDNDNPPDAGRPKRGHPAKVSAKRRTRRRSGDGAVIQRSDGRWAGRLTRDGTTRWFYGKDQKAVEDKLADALRVLGTGVPLPDSKLTFEGWLREWLDSLPVTGPRTKGLKPSTISYYPDTSRSTCSARPWQRSP